MRTEYPYLAVDQNGMEGIYHIKPVRDSVSGGWWGKLNRVVHWIELPPGTIEKLIGKAMTWEDESYQYRGGEL
jgi:hypothetical protein